MAYSYTGGKADVKHFSPTEVNDKVGDIVKSNKRKVGETVATLASLILGTMSHQQIMAFVAGWYNHKYFSELEKAHGVGEVSFEEEALTKEKFQQIVAKGMRRAAKKMTEMAKEVEEGSMVDQDWESESENAERLFRAIPGVHESGRSCQKRPKRLSGGRSLRSK